MTDQTSAVLSAADALVAAFGRHDANAYFDAFAPAATFIFYNLDHTLMDRAAYQAEWALWESRDGFHINACRSTNRNLQVVGKVAIFMHTVETDLTISGEDLTNHERETIVFAQQPDGRWLAVHEHLSQLPR
ncbi:MAG: nuclear transport factor 2 family protein [Rhizobium sp.]|uniref:Ketosteroid isomerase-like protein n=1 Tax=Peteryoungia aggregata LMG 23059 TaxID=1368425 RepID=A0ABU0G3V1_9HYPH|nr:nuclear transport factor 2 family protein [Peteryoungia aggregata]MCZ8352997.1 nuclear transport factor 2 family protein [Rhizobium sp.]MDQ0419649.1 ketosteroid isomerase-like protein [Peteryoungia aggregata LMG 23059]